ncbi:hypothetical protein CWI42_060070 [Ordospora colligata]|uniref:Uncharacterized protein n=1 Tax=Ordospora colligata OC4 TaxID=1354746 RepID=A0A0B2UJS8_9MICR|nr:uncharacterized protein M896_060070 [Ordospora colligata OC4]KHN69509.1 hypothetical protein M896_060070 [Ordospora colligata OC4]TBU15329.1 hypothetical protein CWI41_060060 [Ordospora colligata]TBU15429.1 hypothetical protein CWI40_060060 [Ordospora colligata]TBU18525.1 hypothetical protein CWI42_060070 [Ordospora colligata]
MLCEVTLEVFEETSLRAQKTLDAIKRISLNEVQKIPSMVKTHNNDNSSTKSFEAIKESLHKIIQADNEIENELKELAVFLNIQSAAARAEVDDFKEIVSKTGLKSRLDNISYLLSNGFGFEDFESDDR